MRLGRVLLVVAAAAVAWPAAASGASCAASGSRTILENSVARVYEDRSDDTLLCSKRNGTHQVLATDAYEYLQDLTLRGHYAAFYLRGCEAGDSPCFAWIGVHDARRENAARTVDGVPERLVLGLNGSIAWTEDGVDDGDDGGSVFRHTGRGTTRLDRGLAVDPESLRLRGRKLSWVNGGLVKRATLR